MTLRHYIIGFLSVLIILTAAIQLWVTSEDLEILEVNTSHPPVTFIIPQGSIEDRPLVLAGHGFAGSRQNLYGFAITLAKAGYPLILWDFDGHARNSNPFPSSMDGEEFLANAENALAIARDHGFPNDQTAILGHSMGSGVALQYGLTNPDTSATIAISPVPREVTPLLPRNLLLMAGSNEAPFLRNAELILEEAGGSGGSHFEGNARQLAVIPYVEHISILFSPVAHQKALEWLNLTFGTQPGAVDYTDIRLVWWLLGLVGTVLFSFSIAPISAEKPIPIERQISWWKLLLILAIGSIAATMLLWLLNLIGLEIRNSLGLLVGGYLLIWFAITGILCWLLTRMQIPRPSAKGVISGLLTLALLWLGVGLFTHFVWMNWLLIPSRLPIWLLGGLISLPLFLFLGMILETKSLGQRLVWWLGYSLVISASLLLGVLLIPEIGFLLLILPLIPVILGLHALIAAPQRGAWAFAISGALWVSWAMVAVFPLQ